MRDEHECDSDDLASLAEANETAKAIYHGKMRTGEHSFWERLRDFWVFSPTGPMTGLRCIVGGHDWYVRTPRELEFTYPDWFDSETGEILDRAPRPFPTDPTWACFCSRCGAGSYFETLPASVFTARYWCYTCSSPVFGLEILPHAKAHFEETEFWPTFDHISIKGGWG